MYMGEWQEGLRQGFGCELSGDGDWYRGEFRDDTISGQVCVHCRLPVLSEETHTTHTHAHTCTQLKADACAKALHAAALFGLLSMCLRAWV